MAGDLDEFMGEVEADSRAAGPRAEAALESYRQHFEMARQILQARQQKGWTQAELARHSHIQQSEISRIEQGKGNPTFRTMAELGRALGMKLAFIEVNAKKRTGVERVIKRPAAAKRPTRGPKASATNLARPPRSPKRTTPPQARG
jgi:transcriptional regulator with XRE-family HTH domain